MRVHTIYFGSVQSLIKLPLCNGPINSTLGPPPPPITNEYETQLINGILLGQCEIMLCNCNSVKKKTFQHPACNREKVHNSTTLNKI